MHVFSYVCITVVCCIFESVCTGPIILCIKVSTGKDMSHASHWSDFQYDILGIRLASCADDWSCSTCGKLNDNSATQCLSPACLQPRSKFAESVNESFPIREEQVIIFVGSGAPGKDVKLIPGSEIGHWVPQGASKLNVCRISGIEPIFALKVLMMNDCDKTAGNMCSIHSQMFGEATWQNCQIKLGQAVNIEYTTKFLSTVDNNLNVRLTLMPTKIVKNPTRQQGKFNYMTLESICDEFENINKALHAGEPRLIQLDNSEMGVTKSPRPNTINPKPNCQVHELLSNWILKKHAQLDVQQAIESREDMMAGSVRLATAMINVLHNEQIKLDVAGQPSSAMDCAKSFASQFPPDGSKSRELTQRLMQTSMRTHVEKRTYAFDTNVTTKISKSSVTGKPVILLESLPCGEQQRMGCTPNCLVAMRQLRAESYLRCVKQNASLLARNNELNEIFLEPEDCEDGGQELAKCVRACMEVCKKMQQTTSTTQQRHIFEKCCGNALNSILTSNTHTQAERKEIYAACEFIHKHMAKAFGPIEKVDIPTMHLFLAGAAAHTASQEPNDNTSVPHDDKCEVPMEISFEREAANMQNLLKKCAGHCTAGLARNNPIREKKYHSFDVITHLQDEKLHIAESTANFYCAQDGEDANMPVEQSVFCQSAELAAEIQTWNSLEQLFNAQAQSTGPTILQNNALCASAWSSEANSAFACNGWKMVSVPVIKKEQAMEFYKASLNNTLADQGQEVPYVCMETIDQLSLPTKSKNLASPYHVLWHELNVKNDKFLTAYVQIVRCINNCACATGNQDFALRDMQIRGIPTFHPTAKIGNLNELNPESLRCVTFNISGDFSTDKLSDCTVRKDRETVVQTILQKHLPNLQSCSENEFGALFQTRTHKQITAYFCTKVYPKKMLQNFCFKKGSIVEPGQAHRTH